MFDKYIGEIPDGLEVVRTDGNWIIGRYKKYRFEAKVFEKPSQFGLHGGRVSKLCVIDAKNKWVFNYDRGMDVDHPIGHEIAALFA